MMLWREGRSRLSSAGGFALGREFKAIFFDLDGTLVDIHGPLYIAARNALARAR
jgi:hypothetical protein